MVSNPRAIPSSYLSCTKHVTRLMGTTAMDAVPDCNADKGGACGNSPSGNVRPVRAAIVAKNAGRATADVVVVFSGVSDWNMIQR